MRPMELSTIAGARAGAVRTASIAPVLTIAGASALVAWAFYVVVLAPATFHVTVPTVHWPSTFVIPAGYWGAVLAYALIHARRFPLSWTETAVRMTRAGVVLHLILLLTTLVPRLDDAAAFGARAYAVYTRMVYMAAAAALTAWIWGTRRNTWTVDRAPFAWPVLLGAGLCLPLWVHALPVWTVGGMAAATALIVLRSRAPWLLHGATRIWARLAGNERLVLVAVLVGAFVLRLAYTLRVMTNPNYVETGGDGAFYDAIAWSMAQGLGVPEHHGRGYPLYLHGYTWFVGAVYALFGRNYLALCVVQSLLGAAACVLAYAIAKRVFGITVARLTATLSAASFALTFAAAALGHQALDIVLSALIVWLLLNYVNGPAPKVGTIFGVGLLLGYAIATREPVIFFWAFVLVWLPFALRRLGWRAATLRTAALSAGVVLVLMPFVVPLVVERGDPAIAHLDRLFYGDRMTHRADLAAPFTAPDEALREVRQEPLRVAGTLAVSMWNNFALMFFTQTYGTFDLVFLLRGSQYYFGAWFYMYLFGFVGLAFCVARIARAPRDPDTIGLQLIIGFLSARVAVHLILEAGYRHRAPLEPFLIMLAVYGATKLLRLTDDSPQAEPA
jgi:hypothetical protein